MVRLRRALLLAAFGLLTVLAAPGVASAAPFASTGGAGLITSTTATFQGFVSGAASYHFEYGTTTAYGQTTPSTDVGLGALNVSVPVTGLQPATTYHLRLVASNGVDPDSDGNDSTFTTSQPPPALTAVTVTPAATTATVGATLDTPASPFGGPSALWHVDFTPDSGFNPAAPAYSRSTTSQFVSASGPQAISTTLTGLSPGTTYHFRFVAQSPLGTTTGPDQTFATIVPRPPRATTGQASDLSPGSAVLHGTVNASGNPGLLYSFVYGLDTSYGLGTLFTAPVPADTADHDVATSSIGTPLFAPIRSRLEAQFWAARVARGDFAGPWVRPEPSVTVHYALRISGVPGLLAPVTGDDATVTSPVPTAVPTATTGTPRVITFSGFPALQLAGALGGVDATQPLPRVGFEVGTTTAYGTVCQGVARSAGANQATVTANVCGYPENAQGAAAGHTVHTGGLANLADLAGMTLHYRLVADYGGPGGPVFGADNVVTVPAVGGSGSSSSGSGSPHPGSGSSGSGSSIPGLGPATPAGIRAALARALAVFGAGSKLQDILDTGDYPAEILTPAPGTATISWYQLVRKHKPVLIASGSSKVPSRGYGLVLVNLTKRGQALLKKVHRGHFFKVTVRGVFRPRSGAKQTATQVITLRR